MVKQSLLTKRQRTEINEYLQDMPSAMPAFIRSLRVYCKKVDFDEMEKDVNASFSTRKT